MLLSKMELPHPLGELLLTVTQAPDAIERRHAYDESEDVINERVQRFVGQHAPRKVRHRLHFVVDEELRRHHDEACEKRAIIFKLRREQ